MYESVESECFCNIYKKRFFFFIILQKTCKIVINRILFKIRLKEYIKEQVIKKIPE